MKVAVQCVSPLLQRSLELFLKDSLSTIKHCDVVIRDKKVFDNEHMCLIIGNDESASLQKPFSKSQLYMALENLIETDKDRERVIEIVQEPKESGAQDLNDFDLLEKRIAMLTQEYQDNIIKTVRAFYEK
ncbi:MAG: hypothetical protein U9N52_05400 [Campylobacterota bacterium]|nr:hypothetical protein [Campylobacterota bacterium]